MIKVCHITTVHQPFDVRIFHKEAKTLADANYKVLLIAQHNKKEVVEGIEIFPLPKPKNRLDRMLFLTRKAYKIALKQKADIYHFHDPEFLPFAVKLKKKTNAKIIYDIHENVSLQILTKDWIPKFLRSFFSKFYKFREKKALNFIDWLLLVEDFYFKGYKKKTVIRNYPIIKKDLIENKVNNLKELIYVGGINEKRGIFEMIKAVNILNKKNLEVKIKIVGNIEEKLKSKINKFIKSLGLEDSIIFTGSVAHPEAMRLIKGAGIGLSILKPIPNYVNSLPTKIFEYMMNGLPVVASNFPLLKEIIEGNNCGICVNPLDPKEIAKAIEYLIEHPEEAKKMGENGKRAVLEKYNWERESKKLLKVYEQLLKK